MGQMGISSGLKISVPEDINYVKEDNLQATAV